MRKGRKGSRRCRHESRHLPEHWHFCLSASLHVAFLAPTLLYCSSNSAWLCPLCRVLMLNSVSPSLIAILAGCYCSHFANNCLITPHSQKQTFVFYFSFGILPFWMLMDDSKKAIYYINHFSHNSTKVRMLYKLLSCLTV